MSGHSKWHNIRLKKGKMDAERGKTFTKISREIIMAARAGGGNPDANLRLRMAIQKARENSMPADKIKSAIQRGTGEIEGAIYEEITYEGYGPAGVAVLVECATDNRNRTVAEIRSRFSKHGGNLGEAGCVNWLFSPRGIVSIPRNGRSEDEVLELALEAGAEDIKTEEEAFDVYTAPEDLAAVRTALEGAGLAVSNAEVTMLPSTTVHLDGKAALQTLRLLEVLEDLDDVQNVYANFELDEAALAAVS
ncbi:MAG: YebC/PmpR family DNA-binding transcriptional regulator [Armatimonadetes bacterium]|nr:YebC/PmpR family DNA-binding transcriptional regulator [Armatimonadota bacterium]